MRVRILHDAKSRTAPVARRRDGDIAPYRDGTAPRGTATGHAMEARPRGTTEGAQMGEATGHERGAGKESARLSLGRFAPKWGFW